MPVTVALFYRDYAVQLKRKALPLADALCPRCGSPGGARLTLTATRFSRPVYFLVRDEYGRLAIVLEEVVLAQALCHGCGARLRVLPADILPLKPYSLPVIEHLLVLYREGKGSLRRTIWGVDGKWPSPSTLHAWLEGFGAYALGRPGGEVPGALPATAVRAELAQRHPSAAQEPDEIALARYRSDARRERLRAAAALLLACAVVGEDHPDVLARVTVLLLTWGARLGIGFRSGLRSTSSEHLSGHLRRDSSSTPVRRGGRSGFT